MNQVDVVTIGLGYIGLPTASMLATKGHTVLGVDVNSETVEIINSGKIHKTSVCEMSSHR